MYADEITRSMRAAITETNRRRTIQDEYNRANGIIPKTVVKGIRDVIEVGTTEEKSGKRGKKGELSECKLSKTEREKLIAELTSEMKRAAQKLEFEQAAFLRDQIKKLRENGEAPKTRKKY
jgi:excinuclease ABC subunit B